MEALAATWAAVCQAHDCLTKELLVNGNPAGEVAISEQFPASWSQGHRLWSLGFLGPTKFPAFDQPTQVNPCPFRARPITISTVTKTCQNVSVDGAQSRPAQTRLLGPDQLDRTEDKNPALPCFHAQLHGMSQVLILCQYRYIAAWGFSTVAPEGNPLVKNRWLRALYKCCTLGQE